MLIWSNHSTPWVEITMGTTTVQYQTFSFCCCGDFLGDHILYLYGLTGSIKVAWTAFSSGWCVSALRVFLFTLGDGVLYLYTSHWVDGVLYCILHTGWMVCCTVHFTLGGWCVVPVYFTLGGWCVVLYTSHWSMVCCTVYFTLGGWCVVLYTSHWSMVCCTVYFTLGGWCVVLCTSHWVDGVLYCILHTGWMVCCTHALHTGWMGLLI